MTLPVSRRAVLRALSLLVAAPAIAQDAGTDAIPGTRIRFATLARARQLLMADDEWMAATSAFQRRAIMGRAEPVSGEAFRRWNADAAREWPEDERQRWMDAITAIAPQLADLRIPLPPEVWLVASNGQESAGRPYTRGNAVMLPPGNPRRFDLFLMAHELWHVAARHTPALASRLYAEIGFEPMALLDFPAAWASIRLANPDAPNNAHAIQLSIDGRRPWVTPVLVASRTDLQPGETFFSVLETRLLEVDRGTAGTRSQAVLSGGEPVWHPLRGRHDYLERLGGNTGYVIHPEEAIADNFALLATGASARNPALLGRLRAVLQQPR
jgi:hypothetical protein